MALTKNDLVKTLAKENGYPVNQTIEIVETLLEIIKSKLASGEDVLISSFGKFCVHANGYSLKQSAELATPLIEIIKFNPDHTRVSSNLLKTHYNIDLKEFYF
jgi:nucleoid DNA-binding protein